MQLVLGALVGAIVGLVLSVLFEDFLLRVRESFLRRMKLLLGHLRRLTATDTRPCQDCFSLGDLRTTLLVVEGDGEQVIDEQNVHVIVDPEPVVLPAEMQTWRAEILRVHEERARAARQHFWNGLNYAVSEFSVSRTVVDEEPEIYFRLKPSDYGNFLTSQQTDRHFEDGSTPKTRYLDPHRSSPLDVPDFMSSSFGTNAAVLTADGFFIFSRRSALVGSRPNMWSSSANEALSRTLDDRGRSAPNLYDVMRRGIKEELAIDVDEYSLEMLTVTIDMDVHQWGGTWLVMLNELTCEDVMERRSRGVADKWEHSELEFIQSKPEMVFQFVRQTIAAEEMAPHVPALFYFALARRYGRHRVERAVRRVFKHSRERNPLLIYRDLILARVRRWKHSLLSLRGEPPASPTADPGATAPSTDV